MATAWKTIRVFISSTFRDMQAERDHLVRFVFPRLREQLLPRRIHLVDVDLRWGVTDELDASEVCREIIDECRPRFLCMLGGRYGWVPPGRSRSITADEVYYGVLDRTSKDRGSACFYFRDDAATAAMVETTPGEFCEPRNSDNQHRLTELKQAIVTAGVNPFTYRAQWDQENRRLTGLKEFGDRVYNDLLASLKSDLELRDRFLKDAVAQPNEFAEENAAMEAFVEERSDRFVLGSRETLLQELLAHAVTTDSNSYVCLIGAPGVGKSALLAYLSRHSTLNAQSSTFLIRHFVGASPGSTDVHRTLRRLCWELKSGCSEITTDIPDDPERLRIMFPDFLQQVCARLRVVILLDAVDQFDSTSHSDGLHWLPQELPANARIILSTLDGPVLEVLRRRSHKPREIELKPLTAADGEEIIEQFRRRYHKKFELDQIELLVGRDESGDLNKTDSDKPLYLLAALEELRTLGTYEEVTRHIAELPPTTLDLFAWILERLENDDDFRDVSGRRVGRKLVSRFAALLGASRYGLSQRELSNLLDAGDPQGNVATLLYLLRPYLMRRGELLDFYHRQFRAASARAWLHTDAQRQVAHRRLADYFRDHADPEKDRSWKGESQRPFLELPFHLSRVSPDELAGILFDYRWLQAKTDKAQVHDLIQDFIDTITAISSSDMKTRLTRLLVGLEKASGCVVRDPAQLPGQLLGRLQGEHQFDRLIDDAKRYEAGPWLRPLLRTLSSAEDPLVWVLEEGSSEWANWIQAVAVSSDNRFVANSSFGFRVNIRDLLTGQILRTFKHPRHSNYERGVVALHFLADRKSLLSASEGGIVIIWDYHSGVERNSFRVSSGITDVTLSSNGDRCLFAGYSSVELWDLVVRERIWTRYDRSEAVAMVDKFDRRLTIHDYQGRLKVQETETGKVLHTLVGHNSWVNAIAVTPDGRRVVSGSRDATIKVWDLERGDCIRTIDNLKSEIHDLAVSPNGHHIVSVDGNGSIKIWDINTGEDLRVFSSVRAIRSLAVSNDGRFAVSGSEDGSVRLWDMNVALRSEKVASMRAEHSFWHGPVAITPDGRRGLSGAYRSLTVWDLEDCKEVHKFLDLAAMVTAIATTPDSRFAVYSFGDFGTLGGIRICDLQTFEEKLVLSCGGFVVRAIAVSADGQWLAYGGSEPYLPPEWGGSFLDNRTRVHLVSWKGTHRRESPYAHQESVTGLVITPDGRRVISSSSDKTIKVWDLQTDRLILTLIGHTAAVNSVAVGHEGRWCISGSSDKTIKLWDLTTGQEIRTINGHDGTVTGVATASERDYIVSVSDDGTVKVWNLCDGGAVSAFRAEGPLNACATSGDCRSLIVTDCSNRGPVHFLRLVLPEDHR